jgi:hypothetical protein
MYIPFTVADEITKGEDDGETWNFTHVANKVLINKDYKKKLAMIWKVKEMKTFLWVVV